MEVLLELLSGLLTQRVIESTVYVSLLLVIFILDRLSRIGTRPPPNPGGASGTDCPKAGVTIINNTPCCAGCTHSREMVRRRRSKSARRRPLRCQNADQNEA